MNYKFQCGTLYRLVLGSFQYFMKTTNFGFWNRFENLLGFQKKKKRFQV